MDDDNGTRSARLRASGPPKLGAAGLATKIAKHGSSAALTVASAGAAAVRGRTMQALARRRLSGEPRPLRLCLGSGHAPIEGWVNVDFEPPADVLIDLRFGLPVANGAVDFIYSEHLVEHLPLEAARRMFREWRRVIAADGTVRIATPDLQRLLEDYRAPDWRGRHDWVNWPEYRDIDTPVHMINVAMRAWGHQYLYDFEELADRLREAGFTRIKRVALGESDDSTLRGLETRADSALVVEARS